MTHLLTFLQSSLNALLDTAQALVLPTLFFLCLGYVVKRRAFWPEIRAAAAETGLNLQLIAFNVLLVVPLITAGSQAVHDFVASHNLYLLHPEDWNGLPLWLIMALGVVCGDFIGYWRHRLEHTRLLWPAHAVHHSDTAMTFLSLERFHPINRVSTFILDNAFLAMMGLPPAALLATNLFRHFYGYFIHAELPWTYGWLGRVFVSPAMHRWHHATDPKAFDTNFATVFSLFDVMFGTYRVPGPCFGATGVTDQIGTTLKSQLGYALSARAYQGLFRWRSAAEVKSEKA